MALHFQRKSSKLLVFNDKANHKNFLLNVRHSNICFTFVINFTRDYVFNIFIQLHHFPIRDFGVKKSFVKEVKIIPTAIYVFYLIWQQIIIGLSVNLTLTQGKYLRKKKKYVSFNVTNKIIKYQLLSLNIVSSIIFLIHKACNFKPEMFSVIYGN